MTDAQFCDLGGGAGNRALVALAAGLRVVERSEAVADLLDLLECLLIGLVSRIIGDAVALVVETGRSFGRRQGGCCEDEDKNQDGQRDQGSHSVFPFLRRPRGRRFSPRTFQLIGKPKRRIWRHEYHLCWCLSKTKTILSSER